MMHKLLAGVAAVTLMSCPAHATTVTDPVGDVLLSFTNYTGVPDPSLDLVGVSATYDGTNFRLSATANGPIGLSGSLYVFGINRGAGTPRLTLGMPPVGANVLWDAVAVLFPDGTWRIAAFPAAGAPTITTLPGAVTVDGSTIGGTFSASLLPSTGFQPSGYTFTAWSRLRVNPAADGTNAEIADFAPNAFGFVGGAVPEPASWALMLIGFGLVGATSRRQRALRAWRSNQRIGFAYPERQTLSRQ